MYFCIVVPKQHGDISAIFKQCYPLGYGCKDNEETLEKLRIFCSCCQGFCKPLKKQKGYLEYKAT